MLSFCYMLLLQPESRESISEKTPKSRKIVQSQIMKKIIQILQITADKGTATSWLELLPKCD